MILKQAIFSGKQNFQKHFILHHELVHRMMDNLLLMKLQPEVILDWECYDGFSTQSLKGYFPKAQIIAMENKFLLCHDSQKKSTWRKPFSVIQAQSGGIPLADESVDMIFAHQIFYPMSQLKVWLKECFRVLKPNGCFLFSTFGPDTFKEYAQENSPDFLDLHDVGDELKNQGFMDPVMSRQDLILRYTQKEFLKEVLAQWGISPASIQAQQLTYELIFAQAWRGLVKPKSPQLQTISLANLKKIISKK